MGLLSLWIRQALTPPAAVLGAALKTTPTFTDGKWHWIYALRVAGVDYAAHLTGWFENDAREGTSLDLAMALTCPTCAVPVENYTWYTGHFEIGQGRGTWQFFNPEISQDDQKGVAIDYVVTDDLHRSVTATNRRTDGHEDANDVIAYVRDGDTLRISVHDESEAIDYVAEALISVGSGWIEVPDYNGGDRACWDAARQNVDCP